MAPAHHDPSVDARSERMTNSYRVIILCRILSSPTPQILISPQLTGKNNVLSCKYHNEKQMKIKKCALRQYKFPTHI